jgi:hypothetical protein
MLWRKIDLGKGHRVLAVGDKIPEITNSKRRKVYFDS